MAAGALKAGQAYIEFFTDTTRFMAGLGTVENRLRKVSSSIAATGAALSAVGAAGVAGFLPMIKAASDFAESVNVFGVVFKENTASMRAWTSATAQALGRSESQIIQFASRTGAQLQGFGFDDQMTSDMSKSLSTLAVDLASFYNAADTDALDALMSAFRGETDPIERFNVNIKEAAVNAKLLEQGLKPKNATEAQKALARYALILEQTVPAQGDAMRTGDGFANQLKRLQAFAMDASIAIGTPLQDSLAKVMKSFGGFFASISTLIKDNSNFISTIAMVAAGIAIVGAGLVGLAGLFALAGIAVQTLLAPFALFSTAMGLIVPLISALISPIGLAIAAIALLGGAIIKYFGAAGPIFNWFKAEFDAIAGAVGKAIKAIMNAIQKGDFGAALEVAMAGMNLQMTKAVSQLKTLWAGFTGYFKEAFAKAAYALPVIQLAVSAQMQKGWARMTAAMKSAYVENVNNVAKDQSTAQFDKAEANLKQLRDEGKLTAEDFVARMASLKSARQSDMGNLDNQAAADQAKIDKERIDAVNQVNTAAKAEVDALKTQMDSEVSAIRGETDSAAAAAQAKLDAAKKRYDDALKSAEQPAAADPNANAPPPVPNMTEEQKKAEELMKKLQTAPLETEKVRQRAQQGPLVGGERAGQVFGASLEDINREQLKIQRQQLKQSEKELTYMKNIMTRLSLEFS
jgi:hypothetical protein